MAVDLTQKQKNVLHIIQKYPNAANDEAMLLERYWMEIDNWLDDKSLYWNLQRVTRPETITRRRRELYNLGLIEYTEQADRDRMEAFRNERERAADPTGEQTKAVSWLND